MSCFLCKHLKKTGRWLEFVCPVGHVDLGECDGANAHAMVEDPCELYEQLEDEDYQERNPK